MENLKRTFNYRYSSSKEQYIVRFIECVVERGYGKTITLEETGKLLQYNIEDEHELKKMKSVMCRIKNYLIDRGYVLKSIVGVGYYIMKPKQIPNYVYRTYTLRTLRLIEKQNRILDHTPTSDLSNVRQEENAQIKDLTKVTYEAINKSIDESEYFKNRAFYNGLEDE